MMGDGGSMFFGGGLMWIFWIVLIAIVIALVKGLLSNNASPGSDKDDTPLKILEKRYARGEIDTEEFEQKRKELER